MKFGFAIALLALAIFLGTPGALAQDASKKKMENTCKGLPAKIMEDVDRFLAEASEKGFSGVVLIAKEGEPVFNKGYGLSNIEENIPFSTDTVFDIGSITKQFTAAGIMKLVEEGKVATSDTLDKYFQNVPKDKAAITVFQLLTHSSGLLDSIGFDYKPIARDEFVAAALATPLEFPSGTAYTYSNVGYSLLAAIIEIASGQNYETFLYENLFEPAGMELTGYTRPDWNQDNLAHGYREGRDWGTPLEKLQKMDGDFWHLKGNGGILSTTGDMLRWHNALAGEDVLSRKSIEEMETPHVREGERAESFYGFGWVVEPGPCGGRFVHHDGGNPYFKNDFWRFLGPDIAIYASSNSGDVHAITLVSRLGDIVLGRDPRPLANWTKPGSAPKTPGEVRASRFFDALNSLPKEDVPAFIEKNFAPTLLEKYSIEDMAGIFTDLKSELEGATLTAVNFTIPEKFSYRFQADWGGQIVVILHIDEEAPNKIFGIEIE